jgi:hypothetical protein
MHTCRRPTRRTESQRHDSPTHWPSYAPKVHYGIAATCDRRSCPCNWKLSGASQTSFRWGRNEGSLRLPTLSAESPDRYNNVVFSKMSAWVSHGYHAAIISVWPEYHIDINRIAHWRGGLMSGCSDFMISNLRIYKSGERRTIVHFSPHRLSNIGRSDIDPGFRSDWTTGRSRVSLL